MKIHNPILSGFNPDPSIVSVHGDYYVATSTFEWFPGVQIHHSKDLKNWELVARPLSRVSQLDLKGVQHSGGVWAPCLTYADGYFWLVFTNVQSHGGPITDAPHYVVTSKTIQGDWSEPVALSSDGFDPSLFHDANGKKYIVNNTMGEMGSPHRFNGITLQEYDHAAKTLVGERKTIWKGTALGTTEGPHIYQKDGWYYLLVAEGGTALTHAVCMARSQNVWGPYEEAPNNPILTAAGHSDLKIQSAGHGDLFQDDAGEWFLVHLGQRPIARKTPVGDDNFEQTHVCPLGRETCIQRVEWPEGEFPHLSAGGHSPEATLEVAGSESTFSEEILRDDFEGPALNKHFQTLREPLEDSWAYTDGGQLHLKGRQSLFSRFEQSVVARRLQHFQSEVETCVEFYPDHTKQEAGLLVYYDRLNFHYLRVAYAGEGKVNVGVATADNISWGRGMDLVVSPEISGASKIYLKARIESPDIKFSWRVDGGDWKSFEEVFDLTLLGDWASGISNFTGVFVGMACQDPSGDKNWAAFDYFDYRPGAES